MVNQALGTTILCKASPDVSMRIKKTVAAVKKEIEEKIKGHAGQ